MSKWHDEGFCAIALIESGTEWRIPRSEYERVLAEWKRGAAFIDTVSSFGATLSIKAARIEAITDWTGAQWTALMDHNAEMDKDDLLKGGG
jgi:hypothetical protein